MAAPFGRPRTPPREVCPALPGVRGGDRAGSQRSSGVKTDLTEDVIRDVALAAGMVDTKVCAIAETWSGLRITQRRS